MAMKEKELKELYRYNEATLSYHVDITLDLYRDVYSEWDYSPFTNRDLDDDLLDYLMECSYEIGLSRRLVALWEIFTIWFFSITKLNYMLRHYRRLQSVVIEYVYQDI